jgi:hypothetical protein
MTEENLRHAFQTLPSLPLEWFTFDMWLKDGPLPIIPSTQLELSEKRRELVKSIEKSLLPLTLVVTDRQVGFSTFMVAYAIYRLCVQGQNSLLVYPDETTLEYFRMVAALMLLGSRTQANSHKSNKYLLIADKASIQFVNGNVSSNLDNQYDKGVDFLVFDTAGQISKDTLLAALATVTNAGAVVAQQPAFERTGDISVDQEGWFTELWNTCNVNKLRLTREDLQFSSNHS